MTVDENTSVEEAVAQPLETEQQDVLQEEPKQPQESLISDQEHNWREARRKMQELERRAEEQQELIARLQNQTTNNQEEDDLAKLSDDDIITAKQARSLAQKMAREVAEDAIRERENATAEERLKVKYPDYDDVVTKENIDLLKQQDPELAMSLYGLAHDPFNQAVAAYKMLKKTGIGDMARNQPQKAKVLENSRKPVSVQSVTKSSAIGNAAQFGAMTPELRRQLQKEMEDSIKGA
jgi:hypothetical protein